MSDGIFLADQNEREWWIARHAIMFIEWKSSHTNVHVKYVSATIWMGEDSLTITNLEMVERLHQWCLTGK